MICDREQAERRFNLIRATQSRSGGGGADDEEEEVLNVLHFVSSSHTHKRYHSVSISVPSYIDDRDRMLKS